MPYIQILKVLLGALLILGIALYSFAPQIVGRKLNRTEEHAPQTVDQKALTLHQTLWIGDWHADSLLWQRSLREQSFGHVDFPRMRKGNMALQVFTTVTKSPRGLNYQRNETDSIDDISLLGFVQRWPPATRHSLFARADHQANKLHQMLNNDPYAMLVTNRAELAQLRELRSKEPRWVGAILGTEGSHALDANLENIQALYANGFRMMSLHHFFDNALGGSLHGISQQGLTKFGYAAVEEMRRLGIIIDVSHSSEAVVKDVLNAGEGPVVVSHTGFKGHCQSPRNISDALMQAIADKGGLIAVGFWHGAICGTSAKDIAAAIAYGIELVGPDHVALGSDFDGSITTSLDASEMAVITRALLEQGISEQHIRLVMGENMYQFLLKNMPEA